MIDVLSSASGGGAKITRITVENNCGLIINTKVPACWGGAAEAPRPEPAPTAAMPTPTHSPDYRSVDWYGDAYTFTTTQAACVKVLWEAWQSGALAMGAQAILTEAGSEGNRLDQLFRGHHAWGTMIVRGETPGTFMLKSPQ